jgi:hypothetical protein
VPRGLAVLCALLRIIAGIPCRVWWPVSAIVGRSWRSLCVVFVVAGRHSRWELVLPGCNVYNGLEPVRAAIRGWLQDYLFASASA